MFETIVALATAPIKSALSIIRLSGDDVLDVVSKCCSKDLRNIKERTILYASIVDKGEKVNDFGPLYTNRTTSSTFSPLSTIEA